MTTLAEGPGARPRFALPSPVPITDQLEVAGAHAWLLATGADAPVDPPSSGVRPQVWASWRRSLAAGVDPATPTAPQAWDADELDAAFRAGRWSAAVQVLDAMLVADAAADGMVIAVTDPAGCVVWTGGAPGMSRRAAPAGLAPGGCWAEAAAGTNALGLALATGVGAQVHRAEHHLVAARPFAGTAAPLRAADGSLLGAVGLVGGDHVATPAVLALVRFAAAALGTALQTARPAPPVGDSASIELSVLGRDRGVLRGAGAPVELSPRHTDLLLSLALAAQQGHGRSADQLAAECWDTEVPTLTVRAEMSRLRRYLPGPLVSSRPYELQHPVRVDALDVLALLRGGAHRRALNRYAGPVLPRSTAPTTAALRHRVHAHLREALVAHGHVDLLTEFAEKHAEEDPAVWQAVVDRLPAHSPRRTDAAVRLAAAEAHLLCF